MLVKSYLENLFLGKKVQITIGHPNNQNYIFATIRGFEDGRSAKGLMDEDKFYILLENITTNASWLEYTIQNGNYDKHYFRLHDQIQILED